MLKYAVPITAAIGLAASFSGAGAPADAQANRRGQIIVYGNDPCPRQADDEVVVCVRRPAEERYRIPQAYRPSGDRQQGQAWVRQSQELRTVGATGINSCSNVGPAYYTGCLAQEIRQNEKEYEEAQEGNAPPGR